jgi:hypothetical protein
MGRKNERAKELEGLAPGRNRFTLNFSAILTPAYACDSKIRPECLGQILRPAVDYLLDWLKCI